VVGVLGFRPLLCFVGSEIYLIGRTHICLDFDNKWSSFLVINLGFLI
jgi:hypothetical protein